MGKRLANYANDIQFDAQFMEEYFNSDCQWLVALTDWDLSILLSLLRYASWEARWINHADFQEILWQVQRLEHCLMSGCQVSDLIKTNLMLYAAISGQTVDLDAALPNGSFSVDGLTPKFEGNNGNITEAVEALSTDLSSMTISIGDVELPTGLTDAINAITTALSDIKTEITGLDVTEDLEDDLANVWGKLDDIATILGAITGAPPTPL